MITPEDKVPQDDAQDSDKEDQVSQQDIHSNGFEEFISPAEDDDNVDESGALKQAYDASEAAYTLNLDDDDDDKDED